MCNSPSIHLMSDSSLPLFWLHFRQKISDSTKTLHSNDSSLNLFFFFDAKLALNHNYSFFVILSFYESKKKENWWKFVKYVLIFFLLLICLYNFNNWFWREEFHRYHSRVQLLSLILKKAVICLSTYQWNNCQAVQCHELTK